ncbi:hypothetical protein [Staphylococcus hominis]|uniref:hypothetical protein n=1 Tax=Staphylococcus hominis TaxID=1290 RepID=UPI001D14971D|nr:hypothetical protein [Staphylococcus hominis]MCC3738096.1 hypothetical protein [Staphylococcus hominis]MCI2887464.1 hypothetical protein [Staphylococcus hominis]
MNQNIFKNFENFWDENEIKQKAKVYHNYFENPKKEGDFSWVNEKDKDSFKKNNIEKSLKWGIPNHILGDIDKAKFIIGLLNPGTNMIKKDANKCETVGTYIKNEMNEEMGENRDLVIRTKEKKYKIPFPGSSKEVYEEKFNKELNKHSFYYNHILDKENVLSQELKKLYELYNDNIDVFEDLKKHYVGKNENKIEHPLKKFAYYFYTYYKGCFDYNSKSSQIKVAICHYERIFQKISEAKRKGNNKEIDQKFEKALFNMPISNIELIPYRTENAQDLKMQFLESSKVSANAIIEKIMQDKDTIVILRSYETKNYSWKKLFEDICEEKNINFKTHIEPSIYIFKNKQGTALSANSIEPANSTNSIKSTEQVAKELNESINLSDFEKELDNIIEANNNM